MALVLTLILPARTGAAPAPSSVSASAEVLAGLTAEEQAALTELFTLNRELEAARAALQEMDQRGELLAQDLEDIRLELDEIEVQEAAEQKQVGRRFRYLQRHGGISILAVLLNAESLRDFMDRVEAVSFMMDQDAALLAEYRRVTTAAAEQEALLASRQQEWSELRSAQAQREETLAAAVAEKEAILVGLKDRRADVEAALAKVEADWSVAAMPVLEALGSALLTLDTDSLEPDELQVTLLPPGAVVHISTDRLNQFLQNNAELRGMAFAVDSEAVSLAGEFGGVPVKVQGKAVILEANVLQFRPTLMQVRNFTVPQAVMDEMVAEGWLDIDLSGMADSWSIKKVWTEQDELLLRAGY